MFRDLVGDRVFWGCHNRALIWSSPSAFGVFSAFRAVGLLGFGVGVFRTLGPSNEVS